MRKKGLAARRQFTVERINDWYSLYWIASMDDDDDDGDIEDDDDDDDFEDDDDKDVETGDW